MQISHATDIGLRTLIVLAGRDTELITVAQLAIELDVPVRYLGKIVQKLNAVGWVATTRGRGGGLHILPAGRQVSVAAVIGAFEENRIAVNCSEPLCPLVAQCRLQKMLVQADRDFLKSMEAVRIEDL